MRIVSGNFRGRRFQLPKSLKARPTTDFAKENLFNILANRLDFEALRVLDLFAGTGSIGFEFLSRDAKSVTFVEQYAPHVHFIHEVAQILKVTNYSVVNGDAYRFIGSSKACFDLIFADAPYADEKMAQLPDLILATGLLAEEGLLLIEHGKHTDFSHHPYFKEMRTYGSVHFSFFEKETNPTI